MDFYYRSLRDGGCEVICTRCFSRIGTASCSREIRDMELAHQCGSRWAGAELQTARTLPVPTRSAKASRPLGRAVLIFAAAAVLCYALPTLFEFEALRVLNPWLGTLLPGDLVGCAALGIFFRQPKAGALLYVVLSAIEACSYEFHWMPRAAMPWMTDVVPTIAVALALLRIPALRDSRSVTRA